MGVEDDNLPSAAVDVFEVEVKFERNNGIGDIDTLDHVMLDHVSQLSELSSIGINSLDVEYRSISKAEEIRRLAIASSQQRRSERRQWNPSFHQSFPSPDRMQPTPAASMPSPVRLDETRIEVADVAPEITVDDEDDLETGVIVAADEMPIMHTVSPCEEAPSTPSKIRFEEPTTYSPEETPEEAPEETPPGASHFTRDAAYNSKYDTYTCVVDRSQDDKSLEIHLYSFKRPHMRAFHLAWMSLFASFFAWFSITPLLAEVQRSLDLTHKEIWTSNTYGVAGSAATRILIGPLCDKYGARWSMAVTLFASAISIGLTGLLYSATDLNWSRLFIGVAGSAFVSCQYWTSSMFTVEVAGTANALVAGWGNLGGGVTQIVMGSLLFPLFKIIYGGNDSSQMDADEFDRPSDLAWRTVCVVPAIISLAVSYAVIKYADDGPKGNYSKQSRQGYRNQVSACDNIRVAASDRNTWILFIQYGCCFGVEITMINAAALYFKEVFGQSTESAAAIASIFGWMNLFARGVGGFTSDTISAKYGMRGRLWVQVIALILEGVFLVLFGRADTLAGAICVMIVLSIFVQSAEGSTYGIVPYIDHSVTGSIAGVVGAGGNVGGVAFSMIFREYDYEKSFWLMGSISAVSAIFSLGFIIRGHAALCGGGDSDSVRKRRTDHNEEFSNIPQVTAKDNRIRNVPGDSSGHSFNPFNRVRESSGHPFNPFNRVRDSPVAAPDDMSGHSRNSSKFAGGTTEHESKVQE